MAAAPRNFARGTPPPVNSHEWAGVADPRAAGAPTSGKAVPVMVSRTSVLSVTEINPKRRLWPWILGAGVAGFFIGKGNH